MKLLLFCIAAVAAAPTSPDREERLIFGEESGEDLPSQVRGGRSISSEESGEDLPSQVREGRLIPGEAIGEELPTPAREGRLIIPIYSNGITTAPTTYTPVYTSLWNFLTSLFAGRQLFNQNVVGALSRELPGDDCDQSSPLCQLKNLSQQEQREIYSQQLQLMKMYGPQLQQQEQRDMYSQQLQQLQLMNMYGPQLQQLLSQQQQQPLYNVQQQQPFINSASQQNYINLQKAYINALNQYNPYFQMQRQNPFFNPQNNLITPSNIYSARVPVYPQLNLGSQHFLTADVKKPDSLADTKISYSSDMDRSKEQVTSQEIES